MGFSFSPPLAQPDDGQAVDPLFVRTISFGNGNGFKTTVQSVSFNDDDAETNILKSLDTGKMIVEKSVSFKRKESESDLIKRERMISKRMKVDNCSDGFIPSNERSEIGNQPPESKSTMIMKDDKAANEPPTETSSPRHEAALKLQKVYKSFRTRRRLADCAVLVEKEWWKLLEFAELTFLSIFNVEKQETAFSRWSRARKRVAKVGRGLSKDEKAQKLATQHWLEAIDPRHRYGHNLYFYHEDWLKRETKEFFFHWLDVGGGRGVNIEGCSRSKLQEQCVKYLSFIEREDYEVLVEDGKFLSKDGNLLDTTQGDKDAKWIFVLSTSKKLYVGKKHKGRFQHSSFLAGGATSAAGRLEVEKGILKAVWAHSGHYRPTQENFQEFMFFLKEKNVDFTGVKTILMDDDVGSSSANSRCAALRNNPSASNLDPGQNDVAKHEVDFEQPRETESSINAKLKGTEILNTSERDQRSDLSLLEPHTDEALEGLSMHQKCNMCGVKQESILQRINSIREAKSYQLGKQLSFKWTTGAGPRIGCVRDYPSELQFHALEQVNLSPTTDGNSLASSSRASKTL